MACGNTGQCSEGWPWCGKVLDGLNALPSALVDTMEANDRRAAEEARGGMLHHIAEHVEKWHHAKQQNPAES